MKKIFSSVYFFALCAGLFAGTPDNSRLTINENSYTKFKFTNSVTKQDLRIMKVNTPMGVFAQIGIEDYGYNLQPGEPKLPVLKKLIEVPLGAGFEVHILKTVSKEYTLHEIGADFPVIPAQRSVSKSEDASKVPFQYNQLVYGTNIFSDRDLVSVVNIGIMRGVRMARLEISPVQYNPVTGMIRIITEIEAEITFPNADIAATLQLKNDKYSPYFDAAYSSLINYKEPQQKDALSKYPVKYVIIADPMFQSALQPFVQWKTKKGFTVVEGYTNNPNVGNTTTSIKTYIQGLYNAGTAQNPAPTFVLFVGDVAQVPAFQCSGHVSDLYYCEYTGDYIPEIYYGRFSATTVGQLQPQIDKTLEYEQYTMPSKDFLNEVVMIAGADANMAPVWGNGQINYGTDNYFNASNNLISHTYLYPASQTSAAQIIADVSKGVCFANYTAHGSSDGWADPSFSVTDIPGLNNAHKYPLMVGNCCLTNTFDSPECFGEALLRAANKGAIGYIGGSNSTYWDEDYWFGVGYRANIIANPSYDATALGAYDGVFHTHGEKFAKWFMTQDQYLYAGNLSVTQSGSGSIQYYWEIYHLMGDPSLMIYFSEPPALTANYNALIPLGATSFPIQTESYAYAAVSMNGVLYGAALADSLGNVNVPLSGLNIPGIADVVITRQNRAPHIATVVVANPAGPYVLYKTNIVHDPTGNSNSLVDFSEAINLDVTLHNFGQAVANAVSAMLSTSNSQITITDNSETWGNIGSSSDSTRLNAYAFNVPNNIPDQLNIPFTLSIQDNAGGTWSSNFQLMANAPQLAIGTFAIDDASGNNNGALDTNETVGIIINTLNNGHADAPNTVGTLTSTSPYITINTGTYNFNTLAKNTNANALFNITVASTAPDSAEIELIYTVVSGAYIASYHYYLGLGLASEDWETGDFSLFNWHQGGDVPWIITNVNPYEGIYCAKSGAISDNQTSTLSVALNAMADDSISFWRKVSCEQGLDNGGTYYWYDNLEFLIDGNSKDKWDGEKDWEKVTYPVTTGQHNFVWKYSKDGSVGSGSDCAWIDYILFPPVMASVQGIDDKQDITGLSCTPNPARGMATITFTIDRQDKTSLKIADITGKTVFTLLNSQDKVPGTYTMMFSTASYSQGLYFITLQNGHSLKTEKIIITK